MTFLFCFGGSPNSINFTFLLDLTDNQDAKGALKQTSQIGLVECDDEFNTTLLLVVFSFGTTCKCVCVCVCVGVMRGTIIRGETKVSD